MAGFTSTLPSLLGKYEWVRKACQSIVEDADLGSSSTKDGELDLGLGYANYPNEVGSSSQKAPAVVSRSLGHLGELGASSARMGATPGDFGATLCVSAVGSSSQKGPAMVSGSLGHLGELGALSASMGVTPGDFEATPCVSGGAELPVGMCQSMLVGGFTEEAILQGVEVSSLVPWHAGDLVLESGEISNPIVEVLTPCAKMTFAELCCV